MECKATLKFKLPEQEYDLKVAQEGTELALFIWEIRQILRQQRKYPSDLKEEKKLTWAEIEELFNNKLEGSGLKDLIEQMP